MYVLLGGTFDPIHWGHLQMGQMVAQQFGLSQIHLLPNRLPYYRPPPQASDEQRLNMLRLAIMDYPLFTIDDRELQQPTPSYTLHTLQAIRNELNPQKPLLLIIGADTWLNLPRWYQWQQLLDYTHLVICDRPGYSTDELPVPSTAWLSRQAWQPQQLCESPHGYFYRLPLLPISISATTIRQQLQQGLSCNHCLPTAVANYIRQHQLYR